MHQRASLTWLGASAHLGASEFRSRWISREGARRAPTGCARSQVDVNKIARHSGPLPDYADWA